VRSPGGVPFRYAHGGATSVPYARLVRLGLVAFAIASSPIPAQTIAGRVLDQVTRQLATPVGVRVIDDSGLVIGTATTNEYGVFYADLSRAARVRIILDLDSVRSFVTDTMNVGIDDFVQREFLVPFIGVFLEFQVERPVAQQRGNVVHYPVALRNRNEPGSVIAQFIVDTSGRVRMSSFRVLQSSHPDFAIAVQHALPGFHFLPAVVNGRKVAQLVQQPFDFASDLTRDVVEPGRELVPRLRDPRPGSRPP
jgi:hypothetical protein